MQGESDGLSKEVAEQYGARVKLLFNQVWGSVGPPWRWWWCGACTCLQGVAMLNVDVMVALKPVLGPAVHRRPCSAPQDCKIHCYLHPNFGSPAAPDFKCPPLPLACSPARHTYGPPPHCKPFLLHHHLRPRAASLCAACYPNCAPGLAPLPTTPPHVPLNLLPLPPTVALLLASPAAPRPPHPRPRHHHGSHGHVGQKHSVPLHRHHKGAAAGAADAPAHKGESEGWRR